MAEHFIFERVKAKRMHPRYRVVVFEDLIIYRFTKRQPKGKTAGDGSDDGAKDSHGGAVAANSTTIIASPPSTTLQPASAQTELLLLTNDDTSTKIDTCITEKT